MSKVIVFNREAKFTFDKCGLDIKKNFLEAPECRCGCGGKSSLVLKTDDELIDFCGIMCEGSDCNQCGVFAITKDNTVVGAIRQNTKICIIASSIPLSDYKEIGKLANELKLHCYGLLKWIDDGLYGIIDE